MGWNLPLVLYPRPASMGTVCGLTLTVWLRRIQRYEGFGTHP